MIRVFIPGLLPPGPNAWEHWTRRSSRTRREKGHVAKAMLLVSSRARKIFSDGPIVVTLERRSVRVMDDDNLVASMKGPRDAVAKFFGVDDREPVITWRVEQRKVKKAEAGTEIRIERRE